MKKAKKKKRKNPRGLLCGPYLHPESVKDEVTSILNAISKAETFLEKKKVSLREGLEVLENISQANASTYLLVIYDNEELKLGEILEETRILVDMVKAKILK